MAAGTSRSRSRSKIGPPVEMDHGFLQKRAHQTAGGPFPPSLRAFPFSKKQSSSFQLPFFFLHGIFKTCKIKKLPVFGEILRNVNINRLFPDANSAKSLKRRKTSYFLRLQKFKPARAVRTAHGRGLDCKGRILGEQAIILYGCLSRVL